MADRFVALSGNNTSPYTSWATAANNAATALSDVLAVATAGDNIWCDKTVTISNTVSMTFTWPGTINAPIKILSATNTGLAPVDADISAGFLCTVTGVTNQTWNGYIYVYGVGLNSGVGASTGLGLATATGDQYWDNCNLRSLANSGAGPINIASVGTGARVVLNNTPLQLGTVTSTISMSTAGLVIWQNTSPALQLGTIPTALMTTGGNWIFDGLDFSMIPSGKFINGANAVGMRVLLRNCRFAAGFVPLQTPTTRFALIDAIGCGSAAGVVSQLRKRYEGNLDVSTAIFNNATSGGTPYSWTVAPTANCSRIWPFQCFEIDRWVAAGTYNASVVYLTSADATLTNADVWVTLQYMTSGSSPIATDNTTTAPATILTAGTPLTQGAPWAQGSLGTNYRINIPAFTTLQDGYVRIKIFVAKPSPLTVNIDPAVTIA